MPYVSSSAPLPTNSLTPGPPVIDMQRIAKDFFDSRTGRERVYANIPTAASLWNLGHALAKDAENILNQSEQSREAVLIGVQPQEFQADQLGQTLTLEQIQASAPLVSSLNGAPSSGAGLGASGSALMPVAAPDVTFGVYGSTKGNTGRGQRGVTGVVSRRTHRQFPQRWNNQDLGPGCPAGGRSGSPQGAYGPDWGNASAVPPSASVLNSGVSSWMLVGAAFAAIGIASFAGKKRR